MFNTTVENAKNVCNPAIKYKYLPKLKVWCRTWFTIERKINGQFYFKQNNAFSESRTTEFKFWRRKP